MDNQGWVKIHRKILDWEWYQDANTRSVFIHCLLRANHQDANWRGKFIPRGSFISSYEILANELSLSKQNVRTSINHLKSTRELTHQSLGDSSMFTIVNYDTYQSDNTLTNKVLTRNQHGANTVLTTNKNDKKEKNEKKEDNIDYELETIGLLYLLHSPSKNKVSLKPITNNWIYWRTEYTLKDINLAFVKKYALSKGEFLRDIPITTFFRRYDTKREPVDYIGSCLNKEVDISGLDSGKQQEGLSIIAQRHGNV